MSKIINLIGERFDRLIVIERNSNIRNNKIIKYKNKKYTLSQLSNFLQISQATLKWRIDNNWDEKELSIIPKLNNKKLRKKVNNNE